MGECCWAAGHVFKNHKKDQIATRIDLEGSTDDIKSSTWYTILNILRNAFLEAFTSSVENKISIASVEAPVKEEKKGFFHKLFSSDKKNKKKGKNKK